MAHRDTHIVTVGHLKIPHYYGTNIKITRICGLQKMNLAFGHVLCETGVLCGAGSAGEPAL
jgi:hypothetical protein